MFVSSFAGREMIGETVVHVFGIDIGGSGIKGALVNLEDGHFAADRVRIETPDPSTPTAVADVVVQLLGSFASSGPVGCAFPGVVRGGVVQAAANVDPSWIGTDIVSLLSDRIERAITVLNDADAAGLAEMRFGAGRKEKGVVVMVTLGTGIGTALFVDGNLVPNTELGHIIIDGVDAETVAASRWRKEHELSWETWAKRVERYLKGLEKLLWPDLFIIGGGSAGATTGSSPISISIRASLLLNYATRPES